MATGGPAPSIWMRPERAAVGRPAQHSRAEITAAARYPADRQLRQLIADLRAGSARFAELWESGAVGQHEAARKTIDHPRVGPLTLDCDVLAVAGSDLRIMIYTAEPGTPDAGRLALLTVLGTQELSTAGHPAGSPQPPAAGA